MAATLTIAGNANDALAAIAKLERQYDSLENKIKQLGKRSKQAADESGGAWQQAANGLVSVAQQVTGVNSALDIMVKVSSVAVKNFEDLKERQEKALNSNRTFAQSLETLAFNTAGDAKFNSLAKVEALVAKLSQETGVGPNEVSRALSNASSAKGQLPLEDAAAAVKAVLKFMPNSTGVQDVLAGSVLDIRKHVPNATPEDAIGFTAMLGQQARITDPTKVAENAVPAALLMSKIDKGEVRDNAAIYAAITQATGDVQGRTSRTGGIALALQLEQALPEMKDTLSRVRFMQDNPDAAKAFLQGGEHGGKRFKGMDLQLTGPNGEDITFGTDKASFEKKVLPAIRELFKKGSATASNLDSALGALPSIEGGSAVYEKQLADLSKSPTMALAAKDRRLQTEAEQKRIDDAEGGNAAAVRSGFNELLSSNGVNYADRQALGWGKWGRETFLRQSPDEAALNTLQSNRDWERSSYETFRRAEGESSPNTQSYLQNMNRLDAALKGFQGEGPSAEGLNPIEMPSPHGDLIQRGMAARNQYDKARANGDTEGQEIARKTLETIQSLLDEAKREKKRPINVNGQVEGRAN